MEKLTNSQKKAFDSIGNLPNMKIHLDHVSEGGLAYFDTEDDNRWARIIVGKRGHREYIDIIRKAKRIKGEVT